jgi:protein-arginine kinase activator protein McsA
VEGDNMTTITWKERNPEKMREYRREWYKKNSEHAKRKVRERKVELVEWFREYKRTLKCEQCPGSHEACLEFHHNDPSKKEMTLAKALINGWSKEKIMMEVEKCTVLCANCHRKLHFAERNGL